MTKLVASESRWHPLLGELASQDVRVQVDDVCAYLDAYPDVADVVPAICRTTRREFGPEAVLALEVNRDPEVDDKYLKLRVSLPAFGPEVMDRIRSVAAAHEDQLWDKKGYILLMPHFPRTR